MPLKLDPNRYAFYSLRIKVLRRDKWRCRYCSVKLTKDTANIDHVTPFQSGGKTTSKNLVSSCRDCNKSKGNRTWAPNPIKGDTPPKNRRLAYGQRKKKREHKEERAWARRSGPVTIIKPGFEATTG